jgi:uncharacterized protein (TIGR01244 family)
MNNLRSITPNLAVADQPTEADLQNLKREGYAAVANLRQDGEPDQPLGTAAEGKLARSLDLDYLHLAVGGSPLSEQGVLAFCEFLDRHQGDKVLVHCRKGGRAVALVALHRALAEGWPPGTVADKALAAGLPLEGNLLTMIEQYLHEHPAKRK